MQFLEVYKQSMQANGLDEDANQLAIIPHLQNLYDELWARAGLKTSKKFLPDRLRPRFLNKKKPLSNNGIYLWGSVGSGKTFLLDLWFERIHFIPQKRKMHFHHFMQNIHNRLAFIKDKKDPLEIVAQEFSTQTPLVFLDDFYVSDITDAMIFSNLFKHLFNKQVTLLISSNYKPSNLYLHGLQRARFLPAIALLEKHLNVQELHAECDYRLRYLQKQGLYNLHQGEQTDQAILDIYKQLNKHEGNISTITINQRAFYPVRATPKTIWFDFSELCMKPRSAQDYISIANRYAIVFVSAIPVFDHQDDIARRFINMIDCFYNNNTILICSAEAVPHSLYRAGKLHQEFKRTYSRLIEMQSDTYLEKSKHLSKNTLQK